MRGLLWIIGALGGLCATSVNAQTPSALQVLSGDYDVSGAKGCASLANTHIIIAFPQAFAGTPQVAVFTTVTAGPDKLSAKVEKVAANYVDVVATSWGRNGHQICAKATIHWTASM